LDAAASTIGHGPDRLATSHTRIAKSLGIESLVDACNRELGVAYETAIAGLLRIETTWLVTVLDDGRRQNVPDILLSLKGMEILIECKTCTTSPALIKKEEAWAILQKSSDFDSAMQRVTLGKPGFDETSKKKVAASGGLALVEHSAFIEGLLRVHTGSLEPAAFLSWLSTPGFAEIDRLGGTATFAM
jgi:ATP-dependent DNA helicase